MTTLKVKNLDTLYALLKSESGQLKVTGWNANFEGIKFNSKTNTLLGWFIESISTLKTGVKDLLVASAYGEGNGYSLHADRLLISTEKTGLGLLVVIKVEWNTDNGFHDFSGRYATESGIREITFLLKYAM